MRRRFSRSPGCCLAFHRIAVCSVSPAQPPEFRKTKRSLRHTDSPYQTASRMPTKGYQYCAWRAKMGGWNIVAPFACTTTCGSLSPDGWSQAHPSYLTQDRPASTMSG
jgi:hypothetical protein